jgi:hypothetical protein
MVAMLGNLALAVEGKEANLAGRGDPVLLAIDAGQLYTN